MKTNLCLLFGLLLSTSLIAQQATNVASPTPAESPTSPPTLTETPASPDAAKTNAPAAKSGKKKAKAKQKAAAPKHAAKASSAAALLRTVPLLPGPATVDASNVNVRGQARLKGEVVTRLTKGQEVTVLEEIVNNNSADDEPSAWAKILLPPGVAVWVNSSFVDSNKTVLPKKLNVRSGPGENYSVLGLVLRGDTLKELDTKGDWLKVEAPTNAYAFIAAQYLKQEAAAPTPVATTEPAPATAEKPAETPATPATVAESPTVAAPPTEAPAMATPPAEKPAEPAAPATTPAVTAPPATPPAAQPEPESEEPIKRIVQREGLIRGTFSIQAPTRFGLYSTENGKIIDYLYTTSADLDLRRYKGIRVIVTGPESLDDRWGNTPVLTIEKLQVNE